jgi:hypothetical protein
MVNNKQNGGGGYYTDCLFKKAPEVKNENNGVNSNQANLDEVTSEKVEPKKPSTFISYFSSFFNSKPAIPQPQPQHQNGGKRKTKKSKKSKKSKTSKAKK